MKKLFLLFPILLSILLLSAQTIVVSGGGINTATTLSKYDSVNGKISYVGTGTVGDNSITTSIAVYWDNSILPEGWRLAFGGQPYFIANYDTELPPGTASSIFTWDAVPGLSMESGNPTPISVTGADVVLSVLFGSIDARIKNNQFIINWQTLKEVNNDHFDIEVSKDGRVFTPIATVKSKVENGNSDIAFDYNWTGSNLTLGLLPFAVLLLLLQRVANKRVAGLLAVVMIITITVGCNKNQKDIVSDKDHIGFVRIAQIDKDGTKAYSRVVKVVMD